MKNKFIFVITIIILSLTSCHINQQSTKIISNFRDLNRNIPLLKLPYSTSCGGCCNKVLLAIDSAFIKEFEIEYLNIIGKLNISNKYIGILYSGGGDYYIPVLRIYDQKGKQLSEKSFMGDYCGNYLDFYGDYILEIDKQQKIVETDTKVTFRLDSIDYSRIDTLSKEVTKSEYFIAEGGLITKK
jgi:hypothetical protein